MNADTAAQVAILVKLMNIHMAFEAVELLVLIGIACMLAFFMYDNRTRGKDKK